MCSYGTVSYTHLFKEGLESWHALHISDEYEKSGRETYIAIGASQIISNVPTALLLSGFTTNYKALIIGTNLGGLGTLIASMASLISYKQIAREYPGKKGKYFLWFTVVNVVFLAGLMGMRCV